MALVTSSALLRGRRAAFRTSLGIATGTMIWATLSGLGVAALLAASAEAFAIIRLAGAAYLVYLGIRAIIEATRGVGPSRDAGYSPTSAAAGRPYRQGLFTNLLNPKVGLFYTTLVPQLVDPGDPIALVSIAVGIAHVTIGLTWLTLVAVIVDGAGDLLRRPRVRRTLGGITGGFLVAFGLRVAADPG